MSLSGATATYSAQTFTPGTAPVAGYEAANFGRIVTTVGNDGCRFEQIIESVRTFAGQTVIVSFWAKGTNPTTAGNLGLNFVQHFGSGGSPSANVDVAQQTFVLTGNWTRYSFTFAIPSIAGKTIGTTATTNYLGLFIGQGTSTSTDGWTLDLWGVQVEAASTGSTASPFQTASGSIAGELALCQRYFEVINGAAIMGGTNSATTISVGAAYKVAKRVNPTLTGLLSAVAINNYNGAGYKTSAASVYTFNAINAQGVYGFFCSIDGFTLLTALTGVVVNDATNNIVSASAEY
jgi:hypothetical protein